MHAHHGGNSTQVAFCVYTQHGGSIEACGPMTASPAWHFTLLPEQGILVSQHFPKPCPLPSPLPSFPVLSSFLPLTLHLSFSIDFLRHLVTLFSDMPNSCSVCPWLVSLLVLSSHRTVTVSYLYHVISFPKKLPCTDWTTQSRVQVVWTHQMHTSAVFLAHHPKCTHLQSRCAPVSYGRPCPELGFRGEGCEL